MPTTNPKDETMENFYISYADSFCTKPELATKLISNIVGLLTVPQSKKQQKKNILQEFRTAQYPNPNFLLLPKLSARKPYCVLLLFSFGGALHG